MTTGTGNSRGISDRFAVLAESVNDTARMARINISIMLLVALYVAIMILLATDENLFRDAPVTLPYFVVGVSLRQSYIVAPLVFVWLHFQSLLLLAVLAKKVDGFDTALGSVDGVSDLRLREYRLWLSGTNFVQSVQGTGGIALFARTLTLFGVAIIPPLLLFSVDVSFLKYQSVRISWLHHTLLYVDLIGVLIFSVHLYVRRSRNPRLTSTLMVGMAAAIAILIVSTPLCFLGAYTLPADYDEEQDPMCWKQWRIFCRNLNLEGAILVGPTDARDLVNFEELNTKTVDRYRRFQTLDVRDRSFRFANLKKSYLSGVILNDADLQHANLEEASLFVVSLRRSDMRHAALKSAEISGVDLSLSFLQGADLEQSKFLYVRLHTANLDGANLKGASLFGAEFNDAQMLGSDTGLENARLIGADLSGADMSGANLKGALLLGVRLSEAKLVGTVLEGAKVAGTVGEPTSEDAKFEDKRLKWGAKALHAPNCAEDDIRCYFESQELEPNLALAWKPDLTVMDHLRDVSSRGHVAPDWIEQNRQPQADQ